MRKSRHDGARERASILRAMNEYEAAAREGRPRETAPDSEPDEQTAQAAVGLVMHLAPYLRAGMPLSTALLAEAARVRCELRDADGRVCCCVCGTPYDDEQWSAWYSDPMCRPDDDDLMCASCAFGEEA